MPRRKPITRRSPLVGVQNGQANDREYRHYPARATWDFLPERRFWKTNFFTRLDPSC